MTLQLPKGTRDFAPEDKIVRQELTRKLISLFERYGFAPLETPIIERMDVLAAKYAGTDADVMKEVFRLSDQGERDLGLRFDLTVPLARFVGMNPELKMPFKRYQIGTVYRDGPIKAGRFREFYQYDVDIVGCKTMKADADVLLVALDVFTALGLDVEIRVNDRKLLFGIVEYVGISKELAETVIITIDKLDKIGNAGVVQELVEKGFSSDEASRILDNLGRTLLEYETMLPGNEGVKELKEIFSLLPDDDRIVFTPYLARGLAYYTGPVFEVFSRAKDLNFSLAGGGRYDEMIGAYLGGKQVIPAVGIAFGFEPILEVLKRQGKISTRKSPTRVYVIPIGGVDTRTIVASFRAAGINTDVDIVGRGLSKNIQYADAYGIPYVLFVGEDELKAGKLKLRDLASGQETLATVEGIVGMLKG
jgi:histidyl-tRNA synthetase